MDVNSEINEQDQQTDEPLEAAAEAQDSATDTAPRLKVLAGHDSPETAYIQPDYPYGRRERCRRRVWIETKKKHGQRFVYQTENPRNGRWNAPHASTYSELLVLVLDENPESETYGHVSVRCLATHATEEQIDKFIEQNGVALTSEYAIERLKFMRAVARANAKVEWKIKEAKESGSGDVTLSQSMGLLRKFVGQELAILNGQS